MPDTSGRQVVHFAGGAGTLVADLRRAAVPRGLAMMFHGGGQTRHSWDHAAEDLRAARWTVITVDARGHGDSDWSDSGDYDFGSLGEDVVRVIEQSRDLPSVPAGRPVLFGASMGGISILMAEATHAPLARALILVDITPKVERAGVDRIMNFMRGQPQGFASLEEAADAVAAYQPHRRRPRNPEGLRKNVRRGDDGRFYWHWDPAFRGIGPNLSDLQEHHGRVTEAARRVRVPTLLVRGAISDVVSDEGVDELRQLIPQARAVDVAGAGHMVVGDDNTVFLRAVAPFLDSLDGEIP